MQNAKNRQKFAIWAPSYKFVGLYLRKWGTYWQSEKMLNNNINTTCLHNMVNFGPLTAEICWWVWSTQQISTDFASWLRYCNDVAQRRSTKLCMMFGRLLGCYSIYTLWVKKTRHYNIVHNFAKCWPIFKFFPRTDSLVNMQQNRH